MAIWEIYYNSPGKDTGSNASLNHEWVLLHNTTGRPAEDAHALLQPAFVIVSLMLAE